MVDIGTATVQRVEGNGIPPHIFPRKIIMAEKNHTMALSSRQTLNGQRVRRISGSAMRIATWNVRSMYDTSKVMNIEKEMLRLRIDVLGISESRHKGVGILDLDDTVLYYSGNETNTHYNGVAVMLKKQLKNNVTNFLPISDRILILQLQAKPRNIQIITVYAPTSSSDDHEIEKFYEELQIALKHLNKRDIIMILGDFNAKVGSGKVANIVGDYGLGSRNDRGDRLIQFCEENDCVITNTFFKLPKRRLYTWKSPKDSPQNVVRNQIDFILINRRYRNSIKSVKTYPGADVKSDHNPLVAIVYCNMKILKSPLPKAKMDVSLLKKKNVRDILSNKINFEMEALSNTMTDSWDGNIENLWSPIKQTLLETGKEVLKPQEVKRKSCWITTDILELMEQRRLCKGTDQKGYKDKDKIIRKRVLEAKEKWISDQCAILIEVEKCQASHDWFHMYKKVKEITGDKRSSSTHMLVDGDSNYAMSIEQKLKIWQEYITVLFHDERITTKIDIPEADPTGPSITRSEIAYAIKTSKEGKSVGPDSIPVELLKVLQYNNLTLLETLFNTIYTTGSIPSDWLKSTFVTLPKLPSARKCTDYRTISLMSHILKIFLKVVHKRIYNKCDSVISSSQFGFRNGLGTRDALYGYQVLVQRCWDMNQDVFVCFIDYEKAFDRVQHNKLMNILKAIGLDSRDLRFIENLYWHQQANVRVENRLTESVDILRGVRQGCILSPLLFNIYSENIFSEALHGLEVGIVVNGKVINNIRYADDTILLAPTLEELQVLLSKVRSVSASYGLDINIKKTKYMTITRKPECSDELFCDGKKIERVRKYKYLGCYVDDQCDHSLEIRCRIEQARNAFFKMKKLLCNKKLNIQLRTRLAYCFIFSILLYGVEAWTLTEASSKKLEAFEMWVYRRMLRISWRDKVRNETVLQRVGKKREILFTVKKRKLEYLGHILRGPKYDLLQLIIQGKIQGKRSVGRRRTSWLKNLRQWFNKSTRSLFRAAVSKVQIATMIANLR